jgi:hypothetical protein
MATSSTDRWLRMVTALALRDGAELTVEAMCSVCAEVFLLAGAAIVLMAGGAVPAASYRSSADLEPLEDMQFTLGAGPAIDAYEAGRPVIEPDLVDGPPIRWAGFASAAIKAGVRAVFSFPLQIGAARIGALTLYKARAGPLDDDYYADALVIAGVLTRAILALQAGAIDGALAAELSEGGVDHVEVHQASGMVSAQLGIGVGDAFARLRAWAFAEDASVRVVALDVIAGRLRLEP